MNSPTIAPVTAMMLASHARHDISSAYGTYHDEPLPLGGIEGEGQFGHLVGDLAHPRAVLSKTGKKEIKKDITILGSTPNPNQTKTSGPLPPRNAVKKSKMASRFAQGVIQETTKPSKTR
jgi:hypothetical protein